MFGFYATLVALGRFQEVQLSFLIVGHTHEDIDQRFNTIWRALKRQDILSLKQILAFLEEAVHSSDEAFTSVELFENIWDWSDFIGDYLYTRREVMTSTRILHHFQFYVQNNEARLQYKMYQKDEWAPKGGYSALRRVPAA